MEYSKLYDLINYLQYGTNLHIGVLFLGSYGNDMVKLPHRQEIHAGVLCDEFKTQNFDRCYRCRNKAVYKALKTKKDFGGVCINGIYEYTRPVVINDEVASIIYIGNIFFVFQLNFIGNMMKCTALYEPKDTGNAGQ